MKLGWTFDLEIPSFPAIPNRSHGILRARIMPRTGLRHTSFAVLGGLQHWSAVPPRVASGLAGSILIETPRAAVSLRSHLETDTCYRLPAAAAASSASRVP